MKQDATGARNIYLLDPAILALLDAVTLGPLEVAATAASSAKLTEDVFLHYQELPDFFFELPESEVA